MFVYFCSYIQRILYISYDLCVKHNIPHTHIHTHMHTHTYTHTHTHTYTHTHTHTHTQGTHALVQWCILVISLLAIHPHDKDLLLNSAIRYHNNKNKKPNKNNKNNKNKNTNKNNNNNNNNNNETIATFAGTSNRVEPTDIAAR